MLASALILAACPALALSPQDSERVPVAPFVDTLGSALSVEMQSAFWHVLSVEAEIHTITSPLDVKGSPLVGADLQKVLYGEDSPLFAYLEARLPRFAYGKASPHITECIDSVRHDAGYQAVDAAIQAEASLDAQELLDLLRRDFIQGEPMWASDAAVVFHKEELLTGRLAPLGNGGALGYLLWGLVNSDSYWKPKDRDREAFLSELLSLGFDSVLQARVVTRALKTPMLSGQKPGRGIAGNVPSLAGKVGFSEVHEQQLESDLEVLRLLQESLDGELDPDLDVRRLRLVPRADGDFTVVQPRKGHLKSWLPRMLMQVREELYPTGSNYRMRRGATQEEREAYWKRLFETSGYVAARELALEELKALVAGDDSFVDAGMIDILLAMKMAFELSPKEQVQLEILQARRAALRDSMIGRLLQLTVSSGLEHFYDLATTTLATDLPQALSGLAEVDKERHLSVGWVLISLKKDPRSMRTVEAALAGELDLGKTGLSTLVAEIARSRHAGHYEVLERVLSEGNTETALAALLDSRWLPATRYAEEVGKLVAKVDDPMTSRFDVIRTRGGVLTVLLERKDKQQVKELLLETMDTTFWTSTDPEADWGVGDVSLATELWSNFTQAELDEFVANGRLNAGFLR